MTGFGYMVLGFGGYPNRGPAALSLALNSTSATVNIDISGIDPGAGGTADSNTGQVDVTASASGGDSSSYAYAWVVTETSDPAAEYAVLAAGTQNAAQYNTLTVRVTATAIPNFPPQAAQYRLRCTVTDGAGATATADFTLTVAA